MASMLSAAAVVILGVLANIPASAQRAADAGPVLPAEALGLPSEAAASAPGLAAAPETASIGEFLHQTAVQPLAKLTRKPGEWIASGSDAAQDAGYWLAANASAVAGAAQDTVVSGSQTAAAMARNAGQWFAAKASAVAGAAQDTGKWIGQGSNAAVAAALDACEWATSGANAASAAAQGTGAWIADGANAVMRAAQNSAELAVAGSNAAVNAAQDAGQWIGGGAQATVSAAQDTGQRVAAGTSAAVNATAGAASALVGGVTALEDWSIGLLRKLESHLRADGEFAILMKESGFMLSNIKVGVGMIPELDVEFRHKRSLSREEITAYKVKINNYVSKEPKLLGYFEKLVLRRLLKASEMSGGAHISELHIDLFPLPGLEIYFDPLRFDEEQNRRSAEAYSLAKSWENNLKSVEERISRIEALAAALQTKK
jgi:hypothetical protein